MKRAMKYNFEGKEEAIRLDSPAANVARVNLPKNCFKKQKYGQQPD